MPEVPSIAREFLCYPRGTQGFLKKFCSFGPADWPAIDEMKRPNFFAKNLQSGSLFYLMVPSDVK